MGSLHNTRIFRFLLVLSAVVLTIFIYASYSANTSLAPPHHMRGAVSPPAESAALVNSQHIHQQFQQQASANKTSEELSVHENVLKSHANKSGSNSIPSHNAKGSKKTLPSAKKQHYRQPTIDADAGGVGGGNGLDDTILDDSALEHFVNNDLLEEQYVQNVDNTPSLGNINNTAVSGAAQTQQVLLQQQQRQQEQQQQQNQLGDNNLNKILDSDVLIPTSNLQKFIENADKILKNITTVPSPQVAAVAPVIATINKSPEKDAVIQKAEEQQNPPQSPSGGDDNEDEAALPPSVVMTIKRGSAAVPPVITTKTNAKANNKAQATSKSNSTNSSPPVDPSQGIPTKDIYENGHMNEELNIEKICPNEGADLKLLILITSAQAHAEARLAIRQTWGHYGIRRDVSTAFILGRSTNETLNVALTQENFIYGDLIRGHFIDSYNNLTLKTISALEWVDVHCARAKYVLKTDDDMFINVPKLLTFLNSHNKEKRVIYGRLAKKWKPIRNKKSKYYVSVGQFGAPVFPPFTTGPAYVMSNDIIHDLYVRSLNQVYLKLEDVFTTGIVANQLGIKRVHVNEFLNRRIAFNPCNIRKTISVHMIKANEQFDLWKKLLDQTTKCK